VSDSDKPEAEQKPEAGTASPEKRDLPSWNRGRTKKRKAKVEEEDAFQKGMKDASRGAVNRWPMLVGGLVVVIAAIGGIVWWTQSRQSGSAEATRLLADAAAYESRARIGDAEAMFGERKTPPPIPVVESEEARDELVGQKLEALSAEGGAVDLDADLIRGRRALADGDPAAALAAYERFLAGTAKGHPLRFLGLEGKAVALENQGELDAALSAYEALAGKENTFYRDMALWHQGRLLERMERKDDALAVYRTYIEEYPFTEHSIAREQVRGRLQELDPELLEQVAGAETDAAGAAVPGMPGAIGG